MFKDLENYFDLQKRNNFLTLITTSTTVDGSFLIHHFLSTALRNKQQIYFFNIAQTWSHYKSIQIKLGNSTNLAEMTSNSTLVNFDLTNVSENFLKGDESNDMESTMREVFQCLNSKLQESSEGGKALVLIDDLCVLNLMGCSENFIFEFISSIREFRERINLVVYSQILEFNRHLITDLMFLADSYVVVDSLMTGYSKDIQGQVQIIN